MLQDAVARFLRDRYTFEARRKMLLRGDGFDPVIWNDFATTLGILGAIAPETAGGLGGGLWNDGDYGGAWSGARG